MSAPPFVHKYIDFYNNSPNQLLQFFTDYFKHQYGTNCIAALHHNKRKTNYHIHLIFSERTLLPQPIEKIATRSMFYDEQGKHVRTKKEILDGEEFLTYARQVIEQAALLEEKYKNHSNVKREFCVSTQHYSFAVNAFVDLIKIAEVIFMISA